MASTLTDHRLHEFRDRVQIGLTANLQGLNMTNEMRPKQDEESVFLTPRTSPYSPNGVVTYDIPVAFPELEQHPLPQANVPTSPYMNGPGSQEDAAYLNHYHSGSPPYSPPYDNSPLSGNCGSPGSVGSIGSLQLDMCSPIPPTSNQFSHFLPQPPTCSSISMPYSSCCDPEAKNAACINTQAYTEPQNWILSHESYYNIPTVHIEPSNDLPMGTMLDRQLSSSPELTYYPTSPQPLPSMYHNMYAETFHPMNVPYHAPANLKISTPEKPPRIPKKRVIKPQVEVDDSEIKDIPSSAQLWEFTLRVLKKPKYNNMVCWENQKEGLFRFHDAQAFAALWGKHRNRPNMTYDKVARALRYYYKRNIFKQVGGRLTYRFSDRLRKLYHNED